MARGGCAFNIDDERAYVRVRYRNGEHCSFKFGGSLSRAVLDGELSKRCKVYALAGWVTLQYCKLVVHKNYRLFIEHLNINIALYKTLRDVRKTNKIRGLFKKYADCLNCTTRVV